MLNSLNNLTNFLNSKFCLEFGFNLDIIIFIKRKTNMKSQNLKKVRIGILGIVAAILCFGLFLTGCGGNLGTTISLSDARTLIVNALALDDTQSSASTLRAASTENRNVFVKLGTADIAIKGNTGFGETVSGRVERTGSSWTKYSLEGSDGISEFYDDIAYSKVDSTVTQNSFDESYFGIILQSFDAIYIDLLFIDDAWDSIYENTVTRTNVTGGYTLTMDVNTANYMDYVNQKGAEMGLGAEGLFGDEEVLEQNKAQGSVSLVATFNNADEIVGLDMSVTSLGSDGESTSMETTQISISKTNEEIVQPDWLTEYLAQQA